MSRARVCNCFVKRVEDLNKGSKKILTSFRLGHAEFGNHSHNCTIRRGSQDADVGSDERNFGNQSRA